MSFPANIVANPISTPATVKDNGYVGSNNNMILSDRMLAQTHFKQDFPGTVRMGSSSNIVISQGDMWGTMAMVLELNSGYFPASNDDTPYFHIGWGYDCIDYYEIKVGNSDRLRVDGITNKLMAMRTCETNSKRTQLLLAGGSPSPNLGGNVNPDGLPSQAVVNLYLPWSNMSAMRKIPFDSGILDSNLQLTIYFRKAGDVFTGGANPAAEFGSKKLNDTGFNSAYLLARTYQQIDPTDSGALAVSRAGSERYDYPWIYPFFNCFGPLDGVQGGNIGASCGRVNVTLNGFSSGVLCGITFALLSLEKDVRNGNALNNTQYAKMSNIELKYLSNVIYRSDGNNVGDFFCLADCETGCQYDQDIVLNRSIVGVNPVVAVSQPWDAKVANNIPVSYTDVHFCQYKAAVFVDLLQYGIDISNANLQLSFTTEQQEVGDPNGAPATPVPAASVRQQYRLYALYHYQSTLRTEKGQQKWMFKQLVNNPSSLV